MIPIEHADATAQRSHLVRETIEARGIRDPNVIRAMLAVPRHRFVPPDLVAEAYEDRPLPIGHGQTISQPYVVALTAEIAGVAPGMRVLDVGTGSGYQAAVLAEIGATVHSVERVEALAVAAQERLTALGYGDRVRIHVGDGKLGWEEDAPYDAILVGAATPHVPVPLIDQLAPDTGRLVIPVGGPSNQELVVLDHTPWGDLRRRRIRRVLFVPLV